MCSLIISCLVSSASVLVVVSSPGADHVSRFPLLMLHKGLCENSISPVVVNIKKEHSRQLSTLMFAVKDKCVFYSVGFSSFVFTNLRRKELVFYYNSFKKYYQMRKMIFVEIV